MVKQIQDDEEFEEFEEDDSLDDEEPVVPKKVVGRVPVPTPSRQLPQSPREEEPRRVKAAVEKEVPVQKEYVAVPRVVSTETMLNEIYDILVSIAEKLK